jgi:flagellar assembly factor FliW
MSVPQSFPPDVRAIEFADGLPGFEDCRRFVLMASTELDPFVCLQGLGPDAPAFLAVDPRRVIGDYHCDLAPGDRKRLESGADEPLVWLALVSPDADARGASVNLRAPIVINPDSMRGLQVLDAGDYELAHRLTEI